MYLTIDTRNLDTPGQSLFIAISTKIRDGHSFIENAYNLGIRNFLVSQPLMINSYPGANIILVGDTVAALQLIAKHHRQQFEIPVIGITGSNGKTIVKEWLYQLLAPDFNMVRSPKSYNSQIGVPLSVWGMGKENNLAIFEAGISLPGEMAKLEPIIQPTIGIFTNIGEAHNEGFRDQCQKTKEKLVLFKGADTLVYCKDNALVNECIENDLVANRGTNPIKLFSWSNGNGADVEIVTIDKGKTSTSIYAKYLNTISSITIPFTDDASIENAMHCWCMMLLLKVEAATIKERMLQLQPVSMRLELQHGINDCTIINDTYNSDLTSLQLALNYLDQQKQHKQHTVILSDILEVGKQEMDLYAEVAHLLERHHINRFIGIGTALGNYKALFQAVEYIDSSFYDSIEDFIKNFHQLTFSREAILLKGARKFGFEKIAALIQQNIHQTVMEIDLSALRHNLNVFRGQLKPGVKTMAMVKAFAYGSGSFEIAGLLQNAGADYLTVAYTDEGVSLRKAGIQLPIMVMSPDAGSFDRMIAWKLEPEIFNLRSFHLFVNIAKAMQVANYPIHIKLDTGMHRLGFNEPDIEGLVTQINASPEVRVASIFSHLAASDDPAEDAFTQQQASLFEKLSTQLIKNLGYPSPPLLHLCNSAAIMRQHHLHFNMVRLGIGLYGVDSNPEIQSKLKQISTLKTTIAQTRFVTAGENIGYGHHTLAKTAMRIATICMGYADGYLRQFGNANAHVLIHGKKAVTIGSICMDMCMVDITHIAEAREGDEVVIFGNGLPVSQLATWAGTIPYEIMTSISQRVKRVYVNEE